MEIVRAAEKTMQKRKDSIKDAVKERAENVRNKLKSGDKKGGGANDSVKLLVAITSAHDAEKLTEILNASCAALSYEADAMGTARSVVLDYLGLGESAKKMLLSLIPSRAEGSVLRNIRDTMSLYLAGKGICFTMPLTGASAIVTNALKKSVSETEKNGGRQVKKQREYSLVVTAMQKGYAEEAMEAARAAGAAGGSVITATTINDKKAEQLIGVTLQKETDVLVILVKEEGKDAIVEAILKRVGLKTDGGGVVFSLPVDNVVGVGGVGLTAPKIAQESEK